MAFDLDAPAPGAAEVELAPGLTITVRPLTGAISCRADAEIAGMGADLRAGAAAAKRFGIDPGEMADTAALTGLPEFGRLVVLGALTITGWTLTRGGQPVQVTEAAVAELFQRHPETLQAFRVHLYTAAAERLQAGELSAASPPTPLGEAASTAEGAPGSTNPAAEASPPGTGRPAPKSRTGRVTRKPLRHGEPSAATPGS